MKTTKCLVLGYENTGSGSLTYPESFDIVGVYDTAKLAQDECNKRNDENGVPLSIQVEMCGREGEDTDDEEGDDDVEEFDGMIYIYEQVDVFSNGGK